MRNKILIIFVKILMIMIIGITNQSIIVGGLEDVKENAVVYDNNSGLLLAAVVYRDGEILGGSGFFIWATDNMQIKEGYGIHFIENYSNKIDIAQELGYKYLYDPKLGKIRELTPGELVWAKNKMDLIAWESLYPTEYFKESINENWIRITLNWLDAQVQVKTNSTVLGVRLNLEENKLEIKLEGEEGTAGECQILLPREFMNFSVLLDDEPINYILDELDSYWVVRAQYVHSTHVLAVVLGSSPFDVRTYILLGVGVISLSIIVFYGVRKKVYGKERAH